MSESAFYKALCLALELPRTARESPINTGQLYALFMVCKTGLNRYQVFDNVVHKKPTVDKRLAYLVSKSLVNLESTEKYHDRGTYQSTDLGVALYAQFKQRKSYRALMDALEHTTHLSIEKREEPINVGHIKVLFAVYQEPKREISSLVRFCNESRSTTWSRCAFLEKKGLVKKYPRFNQGGHGSPSHYSVTKNGTALIEKFL